MKRLPQATNEKKAFFSDKMCHHAGRRQGSCPFLLIVSSKDQPCSAWGCCPKPRQTDGCLIPLFLGDVLG
jgi:hypothetical protein